MAKAKDVIVVPIPKNPVSIQSGDIFTNTVVTTFTEKLKAGYQFMGSVEGWVAGNPNGGQYEVVHLVFASYDS
jgi:hypothetical protein